MRGVGIPRKKKQQNQHGVTKLSLGVALILIAQLGGYINRKCKCDGPPGFEVFWKGYSRFSDMVDIIRLQRAAKPKKR